MLGGEPVGVSRAPELAHIRWLLSRIFSISRMLKIVMRNPTFEKSMVGIARRVR